MKRECLLLTILPLIAYANVDDYSEDLQEEAWASEEQEYDELITAQIDTQSMQQDSGAAMQPAPEFQLYVGDRGFFFGAEFLYWTVKEGSSLQYAFNKDFPTYQQTGQQPMDGLAGRAKKAEFEWEPAFRVNAGYQFARDSWELFAEYTYFHTDGTQHTHRPNNNTLQGTSLLGQAASVFPTAFFNIPLQVPQKYSSHIRFTENVLDLKVRKHFAPAKYFGVGFSAGYEGAWLDQHWKMRVIGTAFQMATNKLTWKFGGAGPSIGLDFDWYFVKDFALFLDGMASVLYGYHKNHIKTLASSGLIVPTYQNAFGRDHRFVTHTALKMGLSWDYMWSQKFFQLYAAYEINTWFHLQEAYHYNDNSDNTTGIDLSYSTESDPVCTHGLTVGFEFHF